MVFSTGILDEIRAVVGARGVLVDDIERYATDIRGYVKGEAQMVVLPANTAEVSAVVTLLYRAGIGFVAQGGNTGLCGGAVPGADAPVLIGMSRMNRIGSPDTDNMTLTVEAGALLADIRESAAQADCLFPLSIGAEGSCQIGGNIATNAGGHNVLRYGSTRGLVLGLEVVLSDGRVWNGMRGLRKDNTGYDLKQMFIGAEGTTGLITRAVLALAPAEARNETALLETPSLETAITLLRRMQKDAAGLVSAFEYLSGTALHAALNNVPGQTCPLGHVPEHAILVETGVPAVLPADFSVLEAILEPAYEDGLIVDAVVASSKAQRASLWLLREAIVEGLRIEGGLIAHDITIPANRMPEFLEKAGSALQMEFPGCRPAPFGHLGDGNLHYNIQFPADTAPADFLARRSDINRIVYDLVHEFDGSFSAEHGVGMLKLGDMIRYKDPLELEMMGRIKDALDPHHLSNPGKLVPTRQGSAS